jgi:hypothetical protein
MCVYAVCTHNKGQTRPPMLGEHWRKCQACCHIGVFINLPLVVGSLSVIDSEVRPEIIIKVALLYK